VGLLHGDWELNLGLESAWPERVDRRACRVGRVQEALLASLAMACHC